MQHNLLNKAFITGGYGFIGYHLAKHLLERGERVILFGHRPRDGKLFRDLQRAYTDIVNGGSMLECRYGEIMGDDLHKILHEEPNIRMVYHLAAIKSTTQTQDQAAAGLLAHNFDVDMEVVDFCESIVEHYEGANVKLVYMSTGEVYGEAFRAGVPLPEETTCAVRPDQARYLYPLSKIVGESMLIHGEISFQWCIARLQNPYGPGMGRDMLMPRLLHAACEAQDKGSSSFMLERPYDVRPFVYVADVAVALGRMMDLGVSGRTYNVAGNPVEVQFVASEIAEMFGQGKMRVGIANNPGDTRALMTHRAAMDLMWEPIVALRAGLQKTFDWYTQVYAIDKSTRAIMGA